MLMDVRVNGARVGDLAHASLVSSTRFLELDAAVWSNNTVRVMARNISGATFDLAAAALSASVLPREHNTTSGDHDLTLCKRSPVIERQRDTGEQCDGLRMAERSFRQGGGQIVDATVVEARRPRLTKDENATLRDGGTPEGWSKGKRRFRALVAAA